MADEDSLPKRVNLLGKYYAIERVDVVDAEGNVGEADDKKQRIRVLDQQGFENERDTVLHEIVHALDYQLQLHLKEQQVHLLGTGLLHLLRENPKLVKYITEKSPTQPERKKRVPKSKPARTTGTASTPTTVEQQAGDRPAGDRLERSDLSDGQHAAPDR